MTNPIKSSFATGGGTSFTFGGKIQGALGAFPAGLGASVSVGAIERPIGAIKYIDFVEFGKRFKCHVESLPQTICLMGWLQSERRWYCAPRTFSGIQATQASHLFHNRSNETLLALLVRDVVEPLELSELWFPYCFSDGWRERNLFSEDYHYVDPPNLNGTVEWRGEPGAIPLLSRERRWLGCFGAHRGDPSAVLLPDLHYLVDRYQTAFAEVRATSIPWSERAARAVFAAGVHGGYLNFAKPPDDQTLHPRLHLKRVVEQQRWPVDVYLGEQFSRDNQLRYRYIIDVDGYARTWDAWAWKMMSGSTVLSMDSIWESFFSQQFTAWEHYVPFANDCSDLGAQLEWCSRHETECQAIADRARARAQVVYSVESVATRTRENFAARLVTAVP